MSVFYIDGISSTNNDYTYRQIYDNTIPNELLNSLIAKKRSNDRYIYSGYIESSKKSNEINDNVILAKNSKPNLELINNIIIKANSLKGFKN